MSRLTWADNEVRIACDYEKKYANSSEYGCMCYQSALAAFHTLMEVGHSGSSLEFTQDILNQLISGKPLMPIEETEDVWCQADDNDGCTIYQCGRYPALFKYVYDDSTVSYHDVDRFRCYDVTGKSKAWWSNGFIADKAEECADIGKVTFPYSPSVKPILLGCEELLTNRNNGDFDTIGLVEAKLPNGQIIPINRYFAADGDEPWREITAPEYAYRRAQHTRREHMEQINSSNKEPNSQVTSNGMIIHIDVNRGEQS